MTFYKNGKEEIEATVKVSIYNRYLVEMNGRYAVIRTLEWSNIIKSMTIHRDYAGASQELFRGIRITNRFIRNLEDASTMYAVCVELGLKAIDVACKYTDSEALSCNSSYLSLIDRLIDCTDRLNEQDSFHTFNYQDFLE